MTSFVIPLAVANVIQPATLWPGGSGIIAAAATSYGTTSLTLQWQLPDGATFITVAAVTAITSNAISAVFTLPIGKIQLVNGGSGSANLIVNAYVVPTNLN